MDSFFQAVWKDFLEEELSCFFQVMNSPVFVSKWFLALPTAETHAQNNLHSHRKLWTVISSV